MGMSSAPDRAIARVARAFGRLHRPWLVLLGLLAVGMVSAADWWTGPHISLAVFYLVPITIVAWYAGRAPAVLLAAIGGSVWFLDARVGLPKDLPLPVLMWMCAERLTYFLVVTWLVSALKAVADHHRALSITDEMTGLPNRRAFLQAATTEIARLRRSPTPLTVVYMDCDNFKSINDQFGHAVGDQLLCNVGAALRANMRQQDVVARIGGDEFVVLLPDCDARAAAHVVEKLRVLLGETMAANRWRVTFSIGVVTYRTPPRNVEDLLHASDALQYAVKRAGKNNVLHEERDAFCPAMPAPGARAA